MCCVYYYTDVLVVYEWLLCYLCVESHRKVKQELINKKKVSNTTYVMTHVCIW